jgi:hypothetical protein
MFMRVSTRSLFGLFSLGRIFSLDFPFRSPLGTKAVLAIRAGWLYSVRAVHFLINRDISWSSWALVLVSVVAAWIAIRTLNVIKKQTEDTSISANAARRSADAARMSAQALVNSERAWIDAALVQRPNQTTFYDVLITNYGRTPAQIVEREIGIYCEISTDSTYSVPDSFSPEQMRNQPGRKVDKLLGGNQDWKTNTMWYDISKEFPDWNGVLTGTKTGLIELVIMYFDIVTVGGEPQPRETSSLYRYIPAPISHLYRIPNYNRYS